VCSLRFVITHLPKYLTIPEAARVANVSHSTLRREITAGHLATIRLRGCVRVMDETLAQFMASNETV